MPQITTSLDAEQAAFDHEVAEINAWWASSPKQQQLKRPYPAERIAALRSSIKQHYPSSDMALKLWEEMNQHGIDGTCELTFGCTDPIQAGVMAKCQQTIYVSGGLCGFGQVSQPGMDHADYPWDTVPGVASKIFRSQQWQDQCQRQFRMMYSKEERKGLDNWDYLTPIVADGDMGFGGLTHTMKLTRAFVEAGVAMFHLDDLAIGTKKFTTGEGRTVVPTSEYLGRLTAARMQIDIMGAETMLMCRCDTDHSAYITSVIDSRDHAWVLGATKPVTPLATALSEAFARGGDTMEIQKAWLASAELMTFDDAVAKISFSTPENLRAYQAAVAQGDTTNSSLSITERRALASKHLPADVFSKLFFDWELPRTPEGSYRWAPTVDAVIHRALLAAGLGEVTWSRMDTPVKETFEKFHQAVRRVHPARKFGFGYTGTYDWLKAGWTAEEVKQFPWEMSQKYGVVWHVQPIWALQGQKLAVEDFCQLWQRGGIAAYLNDVQGRDLKETYPGLESRKYRDPEDNTQGIDRFAWLRLAGAYLADGLLETAVMGVDGPPGSTKLGEGMVRGPRKSQAH